LVGSGRRWNGGSKVESWCSWPPLISRRAPPQARAAAGADEPADAQRRSADRHGATEGVRSNILGGGRWAALEDNKRAAGRRVLFV
jgi:hypothetical protein